MCGRLRRGRFRRLLRRVRAAVQASFDDDQTPERIAASFALGIFLSMLPTLGVGLLLMVVLAARSEGVNTVALFASGVVINPPVKVGIYAVSIPLGVALLGPIDGGVAVDLSLLSNRPLFVRLVLGSAILAVVGSALSYVAIRRMVVAYRERDLDVVEELVEVVIEELDEEIEERGDDTAVEARGSSTAE